MSGHHPALAASPRPSGAWPRLWRTRSRHRAAVLALALTTILSERSAGASDAFAECEREAALRPATYEASFCFYRVAAAAKLWSAARARLRRMERRNPDVRWPTLCLAYIEFARGRAGAGPLFRAAADGFAARDVAKGEVLARLNLATVLIGQGRAPDAEEEVRRATRVAEASGDPELRARALVGTARFIEQSGVDLERAYRILREVESIPDVPLALRRNALYSLGNLAHELGKYDDAIRTYRRLEPLLDEAHLQQDLASALYGIANSMLEKSVELPTPGVREEIRAAAERALRVSVESGNTVSEAVSRALLARLLEPEPAQRGAARRHLERCAELARLSLQPQRESQCLWYLSELVAERDPAAAAGIIARAIQIAGADRSFVPFAWRYRTKLRFRAGPREQAIGDSLRLLDVIETFRELQIGDGGRAGVLSRWSGDYYRVSGELLRGGPGGPAPSELGLAFLVIERLRARVLLDRLSTPRDPGDPAAARSAFAQRRETLAEIAGVHRRLLDPDLGTGDREEALGRLEALETREAALRDDLDRASHAGSPSSPRTFAGIDDVRRLLAPDEAMLSFQVGLWHDIVGAFEGGAWLVVVTAGGVRRYRIPDRVEIEGMVPVFAGLFAARDGGEAAPAGALYERLLAGAIRDLPAEVTRLVIIPDGRLHQLPFAALRRRSSDVPLGLRYALSIAPSATIWASWRRAPERRDGKGVWVLADPAVASGRDEAAAERSWLSEPARSLGALPHARTEGELAVRAVGRESVLAVGADASERALKTGRPGSFAILHFSAHAVIDEEHPERSAVLLAPGDDAEDGLLQPREIRDLDLEGRVIVLSGCRTAAGRVIQGEGALSLARAFFEAGARSVVASLWPLRDDDAERFFAQLYARLGEGERLDRALQLAQREGAARGAPAAAWAGLVLLGDGSVVPFPDGHREPSLDRWNLVLLVTALLAMVLDASRTLGRRRDGS